MSFEASLKVGDGAYTYYPVSEIEGAGAAALLPYRAFGECAALRAHARRGPGHG